MSSMGPSKGQKLALEAPVQVPILHLLVVLVLLDVELGQVEESVFAGAAEAVERVENGQGEGANGGRGVVPGGEGRRDGAEGPERLLGRLVVVQHAPGGEQEDRVGSLVRVRRAKVVNRLVLELRVGQLGVEHRAVPVHVAQIQRAKVEEEVPVHELVVDGKKVPLRVRRGRRRERDPLQAPGNHLDGGAELTLVRHCCTRGGA